MSLPRRHQGRQNHPRQSQVTSRPCTKPTLGQLGSTTTHGRVGKSWATTSGPCARMTLHLLELPSFSSTSRRRTRGHPCLLGVVGLLVGRSFDFRQLHREAFVPSRDAHFGVSVSLELYCFDQNAKAGPRLTTACSLAPAHLPNMHTLLPAAEPALFLMTAAAAAPARIYSRRRLPSSARAPLVAPRDRRSHGVSRGGTLEAGELSLWQPPSRALRAARVGAVSVLVASHERAANLEAGGYFRFRHKPRTCRKRPSA